MKSRVRHDKLSWNGVVCYELTPSQPLGTKPEKAAAFESLVRRFRGAITSEVLGRASRDGR